MINEMPPSDESLAYLFAPLHKLGMGLGIGMVAAALAFLATAIPLLRGIHNLGNFELIAQYFHGYSVTWPGAFIGAAWAGFTGFTIGWFLAFCCNFGLAVRLITLHARAEYAQTRDFMDHI